MNENSSDGVGVMESTQAICVSEIHDLIGRANHSFTDENDGATPRRRKTTQHFFI